MYLWRSRHILFYRHSVLFRRYYYVYVQQRGKKTLLSLTLICYCHLVGMAKIVRGSTFTCTTMKHRYLTIWLTYCISIAFYQY